MAKRQKATKRQEQVADTETSRGPGRPENVDPLETRGRADNYRGILQNVWSSLWPPLSQAKSEADVVKALESARAYETQFAPWASLILTVLQDPRFPKRDQARINFIADSLGGLGRVSPRRSRDICAEQRAKERRTHCILRYEVYVECSCGYQGHSQNHACPKCRAKIQFEWASIFPMM
jgi:hypothetical protein